jgi:hypothetical protein
MRFVIALPGLATIFLASCISLSDRCAGQVELFRAYRSAEIDALSSESEEELWGVNVVGGEDKHVALDVGLRGGEFTLHRNSSVDGHRTSYLELHVGLRAWLLKADQPVRPYAGLGLIWSGATYDEGDESWNDGSDGEYEDDDYDFWAWVFSNAGVYGQLGLEARLGAVLATAGARFVCGNEVDLYSRNANDFAVETFVGVGVRF